MCAYRRKSDGELDRRRARADNGHVASREATYVVVGARVRDEGLRQLPEHGRYVCKMRDAGGHDHVAGVELLAVGEGHPVPVRMRFDRPDGLRLQLRDEALLKVEAVGDESLDCDWEVRRVVRKLA